MITAPAPVKEVFWTDPAGCQWRGSAASLRQGGIAFLDIELEVGELARARRELARPSYTASGKAKMTG